MKNKINILISLFVLNIFTAIFVYADNVQYNSYYPVPYASFKNIVLPPNSDFDHTKPCDRPGTMYINNDSTLYFCDMSKKWFRFGYNGIWTFNDDRNDIYPSLNETDLTKNTLVGIGTSTPTMKLEIADSYATSPIRGFDGSFSAQDLPTDVDPETHINTAKRPTAVRFDYDANSKFETLPDLSFTTTAVGRLLWYAKKVAFRAGGVQKTATVTEDYWKDSNIGKWSVAFGKNNLAKGDFSVIANGERNKVERKRGVILTGTDNWIPKITELSDQTTASDNDSTLTTNSAVTATKNFIVNNLNGLINNDDNTLTPIDMSTFDLPKPEASVIVAGSNNTAKGYFNVIDSGSNNTIEYDHTKDMAGYGSVIGNGINHIITGNFSTIIGGEQHTIFNNFNVIGGGKNHYIKADFSAIGGGLTNKIDVPNNTSLTSKFDVIGGGKNNFVNGSMNYIGGGISNCIEWGQSSQTGGNTAQYDYLSIAGGSDNYVNGQYNYVVGGERNIAGGIDSGNTNSNFNFMPCGSDATHHPTKPSKIVHHAYVLGGTLNRALGNYSYVGGGKSNVVKGEYSAIVGGYNNTIDRAAAYPNDSPDYSYIAGGANNTINGQYSAILGGNHNTIESNYSLIPMGANLKIAKGADGTFAFGFKYKLDANQNMVIDTSTTPITINTPDAFVVYSEKWNSTSSTYVNDYPTPNIDPTKSSGLNFGINLTAPDKKYRLDIAGGDFVINGKLYLINPPTTGALPYRLKANMDSSSPTFGQMFLNDLAENFSASEDVEVADLVSIDTKNENQVKKSDSAYDTKIVGVVSAAPALLFEGSHLKLSPKPFEFMKGKNPPIALKGRVLCKVSLENGPITKGDLLTSSSKPGYAMKATDPNLSFGTIIGKALESYTEESSKDTILILMSRQ